MRKVTLAVIFVIFMFGALVTTQGKTYFFQAIKDVFHYFPNEQSAAVKETPTKFENTMKEQLRYPETKAETETETK